jgi:hypothetical protein
VAEGGGLLNRYRVKSSIGGSNPPLSASKSLALAYIKEKLRISPVFSGIQGFISLKNLRILPLFERRPVFLCLGRRTQAEPEYGRERILSWPDGRLEGLRLSVVEPIRHGLGKRIRSFQERANSSL